MRRKIPTETVRIQRYEHGNWITLRLSNVVHNDDALVISGRYRIKVDGEVVYDSGEEEA